MAHGIPEDEVGEPTADFHESLAIPVRGPSQFNTIVCNIDDSRVSAEFNIDAPYALE
ncbi:MAG: hypothetical protein Q9203_005756 [Teloschistes exilis]